MKYENDERDFSPGERAAIRQFMLGLSLDDIKSIKQLVITHEHIAWAWTTVGLWMRWLFWIAAGVVSIKLAFGEYLIRFFK